MKIKQLLSKIKPKNSNGFGLDNLIGFLVLFGIAIIVVVILVLINKFV